MSTRSFSAAQGAQSRTMELRADPGDFAIVARACRYNSLSRDLGGFKEKIAPGAFAASIVSSEEDIKCTANHSVATLLGRQANGSLTITDGPDALSFRCQLNPQLQSHHEIYEQVRSGLLSECSFTFGKVTDDWDDTTKPPTRTVRIATLYEVAVVANPAYSDGATVAMARAAAQQTRQISAESVAKLRKAAQLMAATRQGDPNGMDPITDKACLIRGHLQLAHELAEASEAMCRTARDILDAWENGDDEEESDSARKAVEALARGDYSGQKLGEEGYRSWRGMFDAAHQGLNECCTSLAQVRLAHARLFPGKPKVGPS